MRLLLAVLAWRLVAPACSAGDRHRACDAAAPQRLLRPPRPATTTRCRRAHRPADRARPAARTQKSVPTMSDFALPDGIVGSEHLGVRVFCVAAPDPQQLADQIAACARGAPRPRRRDAHHLQRAPDRLATRPRPGRLARTRAAHPVVLSSTPRFSSCEPQLPKTGDDTGGEAHAEAAGGSRRTTSPWRHPVPFDWR